jgi:LacI family transcriptional regulator
VTSQDVADLAGVSRTTVSFVLNDVPNIKISQATRQRVLDAASELGYVPDAAAQALVSRRAKIIGLIFTRRPHQVASDAFITQVLEGLVESIHQHDMRLLIDIVEPEHQKEAYLNMIRSKRIDGILLSGPRLDDEALQPLAEEGFPAVLIGQLPGEKFCSVDIDNFAAAIQAVSHLIGLGHTRIACITNAPISYTAAADRLRGYKQALEEAGIPFDPNLVRYGNFDIESGYNQMCDLLDKGIPFHAAFVASDTVALGAKAALREHGLQIPRDVALVGFDDLPFAQYVDPPMTTVHLPITDLARQASETLIQLLDKEKPDCKGVLLDTHLVVRKSCGAYTA